MELKCSKGNQYDMFIESWTFFMVSNNYRNISDKARYQNLINLVEKSAFDGYKGAPCDLIYRCDL